MPRNAIFLIDIHALGVTAFDTPTETGLTLRTLFESQGIQKVFFDVRNDADALYAHFGIQLQGVQDIQLMEVASRIYNKKRVAGLTKCIENDSGLEDEAKKAWKDAKQRGLALFAPELGGSHEVFNIRPIPQEIIHYCTQDVSYLPTLHSIYTKRLKKRWAARVSEETLKRVAMAQSTSYDPHAKDKSLSPWPPKDANKDRPGQGNATNLKSMGSKQPTTPLDAPTSSISNGKATSAFHSGTNGLATQQNNDQNFISPGMKVAMRVMNKDLKSHKMATPAVYANPNPTSTPPVDPTMVIEKFAAFQVDDDLSSRPLASGFAGYGSTYHSDASGAPAPPSVSAPESGLDSTKWTCITCSRTMEKSQKQVHLGGKPHLNREKQISTKDSTDVLRECDTSILPSRAGISTLEGTRIPNNTEREIASKVLGTKNVRKRTKTKKDKAGNNNMQNSMTRKNDKVESFKSATNRGKTLGLPYPSDTLFVGFSSRAISSSNNANITAYDHDMDYGLCDKDCGWCGRCMDGVDI
ncbi:MAG: hypothetical protein Q9166_001622 [cf. Caloplaca sp. 2 TL-2023]